MGLFDIFSSSDENKQLKRGYAAQQQNNKKAVSSVKQGTTSGNAALNQGKTEANAALTSGNAQAQAAYAKSLPSWQALQGAGQAGIDAYGNLLGLGGADMQAALEKIPGYQFALDQGLQGLDRTANARGMLKSGNNTIDILKFAQGLANQNYFNYANLFTPYFGLGQNAAQGLSNVYGQMGNSFNDLGQNTANIDAATAARLSANNIGQGNTLADIYTGQGNQANNYYTNVANANNAANQNQWNALLNGAKLAAGAYAA